MSIDIKWLEENVLKRTLTQEEREAIQCIQVKSYNTWDKIIEQNQPGGTLYVLRSGTADVEDNNGKDRVKIANIKEGTMFGLTSFMSDDNTTAEVTAKESCTVYELTKQDFCGLMRNHQNLAFTILNRVLNNQSKVIRAMNAQMIPILRNLAKKANSLPLFVKLFPIFFIIAYVLAFFYISWKDFSY